MRDRGWDYLLEEKAARVAALVRERRLQHQAQEAVPLFGCRGGVVVELPRKKILRVRESDPKNTEEDWEFIRQLRRTDLPPGSFFVLVYPENSKN